MTLDEARKLAKANHGAEVLRQPYFDVAYFVKLPDGTIIRTYEDKPQRTLEECEGELVKVRHERTQSRKALAERTKQYLSLKDKFEVLLSEYKRIATPARPDVFDTQEPLDDLEAKLKDMAKEGGKWVVHSITDE
jgi:hypothetical protein